MLVILLEEPAILLTDYRTTWKISVPINQIASSDESISIIDTTGQAFSIGWNGQGEVGNGYELVNKAESYQPWYASNWLTGPYVDSCTPITPVGHTIKYISGGNAFGFYKYAIDERDSCCHGGETNLLMVVMANLWRMEVLRVPMDWTY